MPKPRIHCLNVSPPKTPSRLSQTRVIIKESAYRRERIAAPASWPAWSLLKQKSKPLQKRPASSRTRGRRDNPSNLLLCKIIASLKCSSKPYHDEGGLSTRGSDPEGWNGYRSVQTHPARSTAPAGWAKHRSEVTFSLPPSLYIARPARRHKNTKLFQRAKIHPTWSGCPG